MGRTADMFADLKPLRASPRVMMHSVDNGYDGEWAIAHMVCVRCGYDAGWKIFDNDTEVKRGLPCPVCNQKQEERHGRS